MENKGEGFNPNDHVCLQGGGGQCSVYVGKNLFNFNVFLWIVNEFSFEPRGPPLPLRSLAIEIKITMKSLTLKFLYDWNPQTVQFYRFLTCSITVHEIMVQALNWEFFAFIL